MTRALATPLLAAAALLSGACGAGAPPGDTTPATASRRPVTVVAEGPLELGDAHATVLSPDPSPPSAAEHAAPMLDRARTLYRDLEFEESLAAVGEAQRVLEHAPTTDTDFDALHTALVYRAMNELALENVHRAREALRAAAALRPDATLDEGSFPPAIREQHGEVRSILRAEPPVAVTVTTEPSGARLAVDGEPAGTSPATVHGSPARHFLRVEAPGHGPRVLSVDFAVAARAPLGVELPAADRETTAAQLLGLDDAALGALTDDERQAVAEAIDTPVVVVARRDPDGWRATRVDLETGETTTARGGSDSPAEAVRPLLARTSPEPASSTPPDDDGTVWESPWLWTGVGAAVIAAGVVGAVLLTQDPGQRFVVDADP